MFSLIYKQKEINMPRVIKLSEKIEQLRSFYMLEKRNPTFTELAKLFNYKSKMQFMDLLKS